MSDTYSGGCHCGAVRFRIRGKLLAMVDCQCRDCQRRSGTGHSSYLTFAARASEVQTIRPCAASTACHPAGEAAGQPRDVTYRATAAIAPLRSASGACVFVT